MTQPDEDGYTGDPVVLAYVHGNNVTYSWHHSMIELVGWDLANHGRVLRGGYIAMRYGTDGLVEARNKAVTTFLDERMADWLFWLDTDMGFSADMLDQLVAVADPVERPVVGGLCFALRETTADGLGGWVTNAVPTLYDWARVDVVDEKVVDGRVTRKVTGEQMGFAVRWDYERDAVTQVAGTGSACVLIHRSVFVRVAEKYGPNWYTKITNTSTGQLVSEDLSFCMRANAVGVPVYVHTGAKTTHMKTVWVGEEQYWRERAVSPPPLKLDDPVTVDA